MPDAQFFQEQILMWYAKNKRDLPWRTTKNPYPILVSEMMLQQTQVDRVIPKYHAFLTQFPTIQDLANASPAAVIQSWAGLGYNRRALHLQKIAQAVVAQHNGNIPNNLTLLQELPGIGPYTASAVASFAFNADVPVIDVNIKRILERYFSPPPEKPKQYDLTLRNLEEKSLPKGQSSVWHNALMDFGSLCCTAKNPSCDKCPLQSQCTFTAELRRLPPEQRAHLFATKKKKIVPFIGSTRYYRGKILALLREQHTLSITALQNYMQTTYQLTDPVFLDHLLKGLEKEGLITYTHKTISLPHQ